MTGSPIADRNLLFGMLAVQMNFIGRDALLSGMKAWVQDKPKSLGQIFLERGQLTAAQVQALDRLIELQANVHGGDSRRSLADLGTATSIGQLLVEVVDVDVQTSIRSLTSVGPDSSANGSAAAASNESRYRILRPHARGGLGEVFVAEDTELHREVAVKEIQAERADDPASRVRFILEAEITGGLEHPGVVPVYGLGMHPDGRPYYAMRFIHGHTLRTSIDQFHAAEKPGRDPGERSLALRQLLRRFVDVCNAMAYAHSRGVLHRDLKPSNVMLGKFGETLIVDWGLAKAGFGAKAGLAGPRDEMVGQALRPSSGSYVLKTQLGSAIGTPGYMSPEQEAGHLEELGPASDIYSLGAMLYVLLTGKRPFEDPQAETLPPRAERPSAASPSQINSNTPQALDAICRKATALEPSQRYATALEMADDVEQWLADEPTSVYAEPWAVRAGRWARRHRTPVVATGVFLMSAVVALSATTMLVLHEKRKTEAQKKIAVENYERVRSLTMDSVDLIVASEAEYAADPAKDRIRRQVLKSAVARYREYLAENPNDPEMQRRTAQVYRYAANVHRLSWETEPADQLYRDAIQLYQGLSDQSPQDWWLRRSVAETLRDRASLTSNLGRLGDATDMLTQSIQIMEELKAQEPMQPGPRRLLASGLLNLAVVEHIHGQHEQAEQSAGKAGEIYCELLGSGTSENQRHDSSQRYDPLLFGAVVNILSLTQREQGQFDTALKLHNDSIASLNGLFNKQVDYVNNSDVLHFLGSFQVEKCRTWIQTGQRLADAETNLGVAIQTWDRLYAAYPQVPMYRESQAAALQLRGQLRAQTDRPKEARADLEKSRQLLEDLIAHFGQIPDPHAELGRTCTELGRLDRAAKNDPGAKQWFSKAVEELKTAQKLSPAHARNAKSLDQAIAELGK